MSTILEQQVRLIEEEMAILQRENTELNDKLNALMASHITFVGQVSVTFAMVNKAIEGLANHALREQQAEDAHGYDGLFLSGDNGGE